jgi:hypothetical protein
VPPDRPGVQLNVTEDPTEIVASTDEVSSEQLAACGAVPSLEHDTAPAARRMAPRVRCVRVIRVVSVPERGPQIVALVQSLVIPLIASSRRSSPAIVGVSPTEDARIRQRRLSCAGFRGHHL